MIIREVVLYGDAPPIAKGYAFKGEDIALQSIIEGLMQFTGQC